MKKILLVFLVFVLGNKIGAQNTQPNDCVNAITVCSSGTFMSNANGFGQQEVAGCNSSREHNSLWIKVNIAQSGTLGFDLIPDDPDISTDFDFWVFGPNKACSNLGPPIRCCITNPVQAGAANNKTGMNGTVLATNSWSGSTGANNLSYVRWLNVTAGEYYYIVIDRPYSTLSGKTGFTINWTGAPISGTGSVLPDSPQVNKISDLIGCSVNNPPDYTSFDLNAVKGQINNDLANNTVTFHKSLADATDGINPLPNPYGNTQNPQTIYARVTSNIGGCYSITSFNLRVSPIPTASISLSSAQVCIGKNVSVTFTGTPGATVEYNVNGVAAQPVLLDSNGNKVLIEQPLANRKYDLVRAKVVDGNNVTRCSQSLNGSVTVTVVPSPTISGVLTACGGQTSQLTGQGGSGTPNATTPWDSSVKSVATINPTGLVTGVAGGSSDITYMDSNGCTAVATFNVDAQPVISGSSSVCATGSTQLTATGTPASSNAWVSLNTQIATVDTNGLVNGVKAGTTTITYTDAKGCSSVPFTMDVTASNPVQSPPTAEVSGYFDNSATITVTVKGNGDYIYSLDHGPFQTNPVFSNVSPGTHTVTINDSLGCTDLTIDDIIVVGHPHFFTPNGDGYNDTWNIWALSADQPNAEISIFDRFGKLLKVITPGGSGWDGTYNGQALPSTDYWFTIKYQEKGVEKIFKSHFSLKR